QSKVAAIADKGAALQSDLAFAQKVGKTDPNLVKLNDWYQNVERPHVETDQAPVVSANIDGGKKALKITALVPTTMAVCYLLLVIYFVMKGGYKAVHLDSSGREI